MRPERCTEVLGAGARDSAEHKTRPGSRGTEALGDVEVTGLKVEGCERERRNRATWESRKSGFG